MIFTFNVNLLVSSLGVPGFRSGQYGSRRLFICGKLFIRNNTSTLDHLYLLDGHPVVLGKPVSMGSRRVVLDTRQSWCFSILVGLDIVK